MNMAEQKARQLAGELKLRGVPQEVASGSIVVIIGLIIQIVTMIYQCVTNGKAAAERAASPGIIDRFRLRWLLRKSLSGQKTLEPHWLDVYESLLHLGTTITEHEMVALGREAKGEWDSNGDS